MELKHSPYKIVQMFEENVAEYSGAPYAISVDSCTSALFLCCKYLEVQEVTLPKKTYLSVPQSVMNAGGTVKFEDRKWQGVYQLKPYPIWDSAKRFTKDMFKDLQAESQENILMCLSFHIKKHLKIGKGGMILTNDQAAKEWFETARYEGRTPGILYKQDNIRAIGWNMYMTPQEAAQGMAFMQQMDEVNADQIEEGDYRDLTTFTLFKDM